MTRLGIRRGVDVKVWVATNETLGKGSSRSISRTAAASPAPARDWT